MPRGVAGTGHWTYPAPGIKVWVEDPPKKKPTGTNKYGGPKGTKKDAQGRGPSERRAIARAAARKGGSTGGKAPATNARGLSAAEQRAQSRAVERANRQAARRQARILERQRLKELAELQAEAAAKDAEKQEAKKSKVAAAREERIKLRDETIARQRGTARTTRDFRDQARDSAAEARRRKRELIRRKARLAKHDADADLQDKIAIKLREARRAAGSRREAYESLKRRHQLEQVRLRQLLDRKSQDPDERRKFKPELVAAHLVLGQTEEGKKDKSLGLRHIEKELAKLKRQQINLGGGVVDRERLAILDARLNYAVARLGSRLGGVIDEARELEKKIEAGDRGAIRKLESLLTSAETKAIFKEREFFFGKSGKPGDLGTFDRYYAGRRKMERRFNRYWTKRVATKGGDPVPEEEPQRQGPPAPGQSYTDFQRGVTGGISEPPPAPMAQAMTNGVLARAAGFGPAINFAKSLGIEQQTQRDNLHNYVMDAAAEAGLGDLEAWEMTDPANVQAATDAALAKFRVDWEAQNGGPVDTGFDLFGNAIVFNSSEEKDRSSAFRAAEQNFRDQMYQTYQDRKPPGMIESFLETAITTVGIPLMEALGATNGTVQTGLRGGLNQVEETQYLEETELLKNVPREIIEQAATPEGRELILASDMPQDLKDALTGIKAYSKPLQQGFNLLDPNVWMGGPDDRTINGWAERNDVPLASYQTDGQFDRQKWTAYIDANPDVRRAYVTEYPEGAGLIIAPEDQVSTPKDADIRYHSGLEEFLGINAVDVSPVARQENRGEILKFQEEFAEAAPGQSAIEHLWDQVRLLNETGAHIYREPGGGAIGALGLTTYGADPLVFAKPLQSIKAFRYAFATGQAEGARAGFSSLTRELFNQRFGFGHASDAAQRFADRKLLPEALRKGLDIPVKLTDDEMLAVLDDYLARTGTTKLREAQNGMRGFIADLERQLGRKVQSTKQIQAAAEKYVKKELRLAEVDIITRADLASMRAKSESVIGRARAREIARSQESLRKAAESRSRKAFRDVGRKRTAEQRAPRRSVFEADPQKFVDDLTGGRRRGDFRSPVAADIQGDYAVAYYGRGIRNKALDSVSVVATGTARHAEDIIAIADSIARRHNVAVRWVRGPSGVLRARGGVVAELFGGTRKKMAQAADELDLLMKQHRLGTGKFAPTKAYRRFDPDDGRVLFRDLFKDKAQAAASLTGDKAGRDPKRLFEKLRHARLTIERARRAIDKGLAPEAARLQAQIDTLTDLAAGGDKAAEKALTKQAKALRTVMRRIAHFESFERRGLADLRNSASQSRTGFGGAMDAARESAILKEMGYTAKYIDRQIGEIQFRLSNANLTADERRALESTLEWLQDAKVGHTLLLEDITGPIHMAKEVVRAHGKEAAFLQKASDVAPLVDGTPPAGLTKKAALGLEVGRSLRSRITRFVEEQPPVERGVVYEGYRKVADTLPKSRIKLPEFGLDLRGGLSDIMPYVDVFAARGGKMLQQHKRMRAWLRLQVRIAEQSGPVEWKKLIDPDDLLNIGGKEFDDYAKVKALYRAETQALGEDFADLTFDAFKKLNDDVAEAVDKARDWGQTTPYVKGGGPAAWYDEAGSMPGGVGALEDFDPRIISAKQEALEGTGMTVRMYDEARYVLQDSIVREKRFYDLDVKADARALKDGITYEEAFLIERDLMAQRLANEKLKRWALRSPYGTSAEDIWDDFVRSIQEEELGVPGERLVTGWQHRAARTAVADMVGVKPTVVKTVQALPERPLAELGDGLTRPLFHGTSAQNLDTFVDELGNLHLKANNHDRQVWFSEGADYAADYAGPFAGVGDRGGYVLAVDGRAIRQVADEVADDLGEGLAYRVHRMGDEIVIPAGQWQVAHGQPGARPLRVGIVRKTVSHAAGQAAVLDDAAWARIMKPLAPSMEDAKAAREWLTEHGHWAPKTEEDIRLGRRVWSAAEESDYYRANWGEQPRWTDLDHLEKLGAFDSEIAYSDAMAKLGVWDNTVDMELRLSGDSAEAQQLKILWGDGDKVKVLRSIEDQRDWLRQRWGSHVYAKPTGTRPGHFRRIPWLMDPSSSEYRRYLRNYQGKWIDDTLMPANEAKDLLDVVTRRAAHNVEQLKKAAREGDGVLLEQTILQESMRLTDDLIANPRWRPLLRIRDGVSLGRNNPLYSAFATLGYIQRFNTITQTAFGFLNAFESSIVGFKNWLARVHLRANTTIGNADVPPIVHQRFPTIESTGLGSGTTVWDRVGKGSKGRFDEAIGRLKEPTRGVDDVYDLVVGGLRASTEVGLEISARYEQALKLMMFKRLYTDRWARFLRAGMDEKQADLLARTIAAKMTNNFFPSMAGRSIWFKTLNEVIPFLHYAWATTTLYAKEFIAHPWIMHKMKVLGDELERANRESWEADHPGTEYPNDGSARKFNFTVGGETFAIDFMGLSDVSRGFRAIVLLTSGEQVPLHKVITTFLRVPHPWQAQLYAYMMDEPSWYTGQKVTRGQVAWPAGLLEWYGNSLEDGTINEADWFRLLTRMAFFTEADSLNPLDAYSAAYFSLEDPDAKAKLLAEHPELVDYWRQGDPNPARQILDKNGITKPNYFKYASDADLEEFDVARRQLGALQQEFQDRLQDYLDTGGSPLDDAYKSLKEERYQAIIAFRNRNLAYQRYDTFFDGPEKWSQELQQEYKDMLYDKFAHFDDLMPVRSNYKSDVKYQEALRDFYKVKGAWIDAHPVLFETLGRERAQIEAAVADVYQEMAEVYEDIGERNLRIAKAEAAGKDRLGDALRGINELLYESIEDTTIVTVDRTVPDDVKQAIAEGGATAEVEERITGSEDIGTSISIPGATDQRYRNADKAEKKQMRRDFWYREAIEKLFDTSKDGSDFLQKLDNRPRLKAEYLERLKVNDPAGYSNFVEREYYHRKLDRVMDLIDRTGDWSHWWNALEKDKRFRAYYMKSHPEKFAGQFRGNLGNFKKLGKLVKAATDSGDWSKFYQALKKDKKLRDWWLDQEPGRRRKWEAEAQYLAQIGPLIQKAIKTGDWTEFNRRLRTDKKLAEEYFKRNPERRSAWVRNEAYSAAMRRWSQVAKKNPEKSSQYFDSLPQWMKRKYLNQNPQAVKGVANNAYTRAMTKWGQLFETAGSATAMRYFNSLPKWIKDRYFASKPGSRQSFAQNDAYGRYMRGWIAFFNRNDFEGAEAYFDKLPSWVKERYWTNNPDKRPGAGGSGSFSGRPPWEVDEDFQKKLARFYTATKEEKGAMLRNDAAFRAYFRSRGGPEGRRTKILAGYRGLPDDAWLKRAYREKYPEVFSEEAAGLRRHESFYEFLRDHPDMKAPVADAIEHLTLTYIKSIQGYAVPPKPLENERLTEEQRRRKARLRHNRENPEWKVGPLVPREVPGQKNVLTGVA